MNRRALDRYMDKQLAERERLQRELEKVNRNIEACKVIANGISNPELNKFADALYDIAVANIESGKQKDE